jgi:hypothetical protein
VEARRVREASLGRSGRLAAGAGWRDRCGPRPAHRMQHGRRLDGPDYFHPVLKRLADARASRGSQMCGAPQWIRTTDLRLRRPGLLLAVCVEARPVVLAPLALRAPGTLNAGRGARARRARRRVLRLRLAEPLLLPGLMLVRRVGLVVGSSHARGRTRRASPVVVSRDMAGGCHVVCAVGGHDSNQQQALVSISKRPARGAPRRAR